MKTNIKRYLKTAIRGLVRTVWGTASAILIILAVIRFITIPQCGGYLAIAEFILAVSSLVLGCWNVYQQGIGSFKKVR